MLIELLDTNRTIVTVFLGAYLKKFFLHIYILLESLDSIVGTAE